MRSPARFTSDPVSLVAADIRLGCGQQASPPAGLKILIQNICQVAAMQKASVVQWIIHFALH
jgi:hypothetical protein